MPRPFIQDFREAVRDADIPPTDKSVLRTMETYAKGDGTGVRASLSTIAKGTGISRRTCVFVVKRAQQAGWLKQVSSGKSARVPSVYDLHIGQPYKIDYATGERSAAQVNDTSERGSERSTATALVNDGSLVNETALTSERNDTQLVNEGHHKQVPLGTSKELETTARETDDCDPSEDHETECNSSEPQRDSFADENSLSLILDPTLARQYASLADCGHGYDHELDGEHVPSGCPSDRAHKPEVNTDGCSVCGETSNPDGSTSLVCFGCGRSSKDCRCHVRGTRLQGTPRDFRCDRHLDH